MPYGLKALGRYKGRLDAEWMLPAVAMRSATHEELAIISGSGLLHQMQATQPGLIRNVAVHYPNRKFVHRNRTEC
jgi:hypothetical protein